MSLFRVGCGRRWSCRMPGHWQKACRLPRAAMTWRIRSSLHRQAYASAQAHLCLRGRLGSLAGGRRRSTRAHVALVVLAYRAASKFMAVKRKSEFRRQNLD